MCGIFYALLSTDMTAAGWQKTASLRPDSRPLFWALLISLGVHALLFWLLVVVGIAMMAFTSTRQKVMLETKRLQQLRAQAKPQEPQMIFVEVDPSQAVVEPPKDAKYYSARSTKAANPDPQANTDKPKIDGTQVHVIETQDIPRTKQFPLQPSPPKETAPAEEKPETKPEPQPKKDQAPGDLALLTKPSKPADPPEHQRPHTLAEVRPMTKMRQEGGVPRAQLASSLDTKGSPLGEYDDRVVNAIRQHWYDLLDSHSVNLDRVGKVVVEFRLNYDGRITDMKVLDSDVGDLLSYLCQAAILDPAPYEKWPDNMRRMIDAPYREVTFTFYYE